MPFSGTFDTMSLADVMQWIHAAKQSGTLTVSVEMEDTYLVFQEGEMVQVGSDDPLRLDLGQVLLNRQLISEEKLRKVVSGLTLGESLVDKLIAEGTVEEDTIARVQVDYILETVLDLFAADEGSFQFSAAGSSQSLLLPPDIPQAGVLKKPLSTQEVIIEGMRRVDEWIRIREIFPSSYEVISAKGDGSDNPVWQALKEIGDPISIGDLCLRIGGSRFAVFQKLFQAQRDGLVAIDQMSITKGCHSQLGPIEMLIDNARVLLEEQQFDEAREILSTVVGLSPESQEARDLLKQLRAVQLEHLYQQISPHLVPRLAVDSSELGDFQLSPRETYLASRLKGGWDVATLIMATPLGELETLRILRKLVHAGIVGLSEN